MSNPIDDEDVARAQLTAMSLRRRIGAVAASVAVTEDWVADTLERAASARPHDAARLRAKAAHARAFATRQRERAAAYGPE